ncbi:helix-turn-helix domain-containing protein [Neoroseomonas rubea]|uniref:helix-turn-helix domain-containing protein n=1 Tax=Neoroseomonas rubea TaxID=2748666 RepID=UPI0018DF4775|nr:helix-turn-helix domain-containing protein [Roseomonas rubea]
MSNWNPPGRGAAARPPTRLFTVEQTAERLNVCGKTVRRLIKAELLPAVRIGRAVRVSEDDLRVYLATRRS